MSGQAPVEPPDEFTLGLAELLRDIPGGRSVNQEVARKALGVLLRAGSLEVYYIYGRGTTYVPQITTRLVGLDVPRAVEIGMQEANMEPQVIARLLKRGYVAMLGRISAARRTTTPTLVVDLLTVGPGSMAWRARVLRAYPPAAQALRKMITDSGALFGPEVASASSRLAESIPTVPPASKLKVATPIIYTVIV